MWQKYFLSKKNPLSHFINYFFLKLYLINKNFYSHFAVNTSAKLANNFGSETKKYFICYFLNYATKHIFDLVSNHYLYTSIFQNNFCITWWWIDVDLYSRAMASRELKSSRLHPLERFSIDTRSVVSTSA